MTLHPQAVAALELWSQGAERRRPGLRRRPASPPCAETRWRPPRWSDKEPVDRVEDVDADGVRCRLYVPDRCPERHGVLFLHGGGFVFGDVDTHDGQARRLANRTGSAVLAVDYRRPPEHRFPAAPDDVDTALRLAARARRAASASTRPGGRLRGQRRRQPRAGRGAAQPRTLLAATVLVYPFVDATAAMPSYAATDGGLTRARGGVVLAAVRPRRADDLVDPDLAPYPRDRLRARCRRRCPGRRARRARRRGPRARPPDRGRRRDGRGRRRTPA